MKTEANSRRNQPRKAELVHRNVGQEMTLKPNYFRGLAMTMLWVWGAILILSGAIPYFQGHHVDWANVFAPAIIGGPFLGLGVCVMFTPREIRWNEEGISLRVFFPKSGDYTWRQLEAYSTWGGRYSTFLLKLEGVQSYQIVPVCFRPEEWKVFQSFLRARFPEKKIWVWLGPIPVRFGKE